MRNWNEVRNQRRESKPQQMEFAATSIDACAACRRLSPRRRTKVKSKFFSLLRSSGSRTGKLRLRLHNVVGLGRAGRGGFSGRILCPKSHPVGLPCGPQPPNAPVLGKRWRYEELRFVRTAAGSSTEKSVSEITLKGSSYKIRETKLVRHSTNK